MYCSLNENVCVVEVRRRIDEKQLVISDSVKIQFFKFLFVKRNFVVVFGFCFWQVKKNFMVIGSKRYNMKIMQFFMQFMIDLGCYSIGDVDEK